MSIENGVLLVQALYPFTGKNNDELCFKKGDLIVVTQKEEGGWWEGTLDDNTGWFPSNYVKEHKITEGGAICNTDVESPPLSPQQSQQQVVYRTMVSKEIVESERNHVIELQSIYSKYLTPLLASNMMNESEFKQLTGNLEEVISVHNRLLSLLEEQFELSSKEQRIGGTFLKIAPSLQNAHKVYISNHPKAVCIIEKYKDELNSFMECQGASRPGTLVLTTALSQPFRRLDKYPGVLQEFQRHIEESHPDRGDTQRSTHVFRDLASACSSIRRQKQLELEVVTNKIHGWEGGESLSVLGEILHMRSVALLPDNRDRYLVLFPSCLVVLALSSRASSFIFEGKYQLNSISVNKLEDGSQYKNSFEITGNHMNSIIAICQSSTDQQQWVEILNQHIQCSKCTPLGSQKSSSAYNSPPALPAHRSLASLSENIFVSRPYAILTKYFANLYRKKVITKQLLRSLIGIVENQEEAAKVILRTHRSEYSLQLTSSSSGVDEPPVDNTNSSQYFTLARRKRRVKDDPGLLSPLPQRKDYNKSDQCNLQKWKFTPLITFPNFKSSDHFESDDSSSSYVSDEKEKYFIPNYNSSRTYCTIPLDTYNGKTSDIQNCYEDDNRFYLQSDDCIFRHNSSNIITSNVYNVSESEAPSLSHSTSKSLPTLTSSQKKDLRSYSDKEITSTKNLLSSTFSIPAPAIVISDYVTYTSDSESANSKNVCNQTIYGSSSNETITQTDENLSFKQKSFPFKSKKLLTCYFSSCSGDDELTSCDYYESHRNHTPTINTLFSKSEPDIHYHVNSKPEETFSYESHYVQITKNVEDPHIKECMCESHSLRSSDSGLADVLSHTECCLQMSEPPVGLGRSSPSSRLSRCSHSSSSRLGRYRSSFVRHATPEVSSECDSLLPASTTPTPCCTPCTSAPLSCVSDSTVSILEAAAALASPYTTVTSSESTYRSGLYAHWWMKASVCPKTINANQIPIPLKSEVTSKPLHLKPSCHRMRGSRYRVGRGAFPSISVLSEVNLDDEVSDNVNNVSVEETKSEKSTMTHLDLEDTLLCRDPSFESQASQLSQVTVIRQIGDHSFSSQHSLQRNETQNTYELLTPQISLTTNENNGFSDISSMHSFYESEEGAGEMSSVSRDPSEGYLLNFNRQWSSHSDMGPQPSLSRTYCSSLNLSFRPVVKLSDVNVSGDFKEAVNNTSGIPMAKLNVYGEIVKNETSLPFHRSKSLPQSLFLSTNKGSHIPVLPHHISTSTNGKASAKPWSLSCLRPSPPLRPGFSLKEDKKKTKKKEETWHEDDALILKVIEYYCTSAKTRYTVNSSLIDNPQVIIAADEKLIVEETRGNKIILEEKSLVDTVYALKDQLANMVQNYQELRHEFELEKKITQNLRHIIEQYLPMKKDANKLSNL